MPHCCVQLLNTPLILPYKPWTMNDLRPGWHNLGINGMMSLNLISCTTKPA